MHEFKRGSVKPAFLAKVPVVPVCIDGAYKIFEGNKGLRVKPAGGTCVFWKTSGNRTDEQDRTA